jgi:membrane protein implicated in regulation of membrane protease activity
MTHEPTAGGIGELPPPVGPPVARPRRPRIWILVAGGWVALCWLLLILSAVTADIGGVLLAIVAMLPVSLWWRFRYWRKKETPFYGAGYTYEEETTYLVETGKYGEYTPEGNLSAIVTEHDAVRGTVTRANPQWGKRALGSMIAGFIFPMRDALRELRGARGGGPAAAPPPS